MTQTFACPAAQIGGRALVLFVNGSQLMNIVSWVFQALAAERRAKLPPDRRCAMISPQPRNVSWFASLRPSLRYSLLTVMWLGLAALAWLVVAEN